MQAEPRELPRPNMFAAICIGIALARVVYFFITGQA